MTRREKLLEKARNNPKGLRFEELERLARYYGFELDHQTGSHRTYKREGSTARLNLQPDKNGRAKPYQVRQVLGEIEVIEREQEE